MNHRYIECEAFTTIIDKKDCAYHKPLGWSTTEWHTHNRGQLVYAEYGIMRLFVDSDTYYIPSWHAAWIPAGVTHKLVTECEELMFYTLYLDHSTLTHQAYDRVSIFPVNGMMRDMICYTKRWQLNGAADAQEINFLGTIKLLLPEYAIHQFHLHIPLPTNATLLEIKDYIANNLDTKLKAAGIAGNFNLSERSMHRLFLKDLKMSFIQFQKLMRIARSIELLSSPGKRVSEVAYEVGYESITSFSKSFREVVGHPPSGLYRKKDNP